MIGRQDAITKEIYGRLKHIVDEVYIKRGISPGEVKRFFLNRKNFRKLILDLRDLKHVYDDDKREMPFENIVHDILFFRIIADRIYHEKDNPHNESLLLNYSNFIVKIL